MPSHIFTRVGAWSESLAANPASALSDTAAGFNTLHAYDYMACAHLPLGQDRAAKAVRDSGATEAELARLGRLRDAAAELKIGYRVEQIGIQIDVVRGFAAFKAGQADAGIARPRRPMSAHPA